MTRSLTFDRIGTTRDSDEPVLRAEFEDTGSFVEFIVHGEEPIVRVWLVESRVKGDMKLILDEVCRQLETTRVDFLEPDIGTVEEHVTNYQKVTEEVPHPDRPGTVKSTRLECTWQYE